MGEFTNTDLNNLYQEIRLVRSLSPLQLAGNPEPVFQVIDTLALIVADYEGQLRRLRADLDALRAAPDLKAICGGTDA